MYEIIKKIIVLKILAFFEYNSEYYFSIHTRFKKFSNEKLEKYYSSYSELNKDYGIVIQGPVILKDEFTYNTLRLYRHLYPNISIVLSTWEKTEKSVIKKFEQIGVTVILNELPEYKGVVNINLQLITTQAGINCLQKQDVKYILKVRTDQRICRNIDFLSGMRNLQKAFPIEKENISERLVIINANTFKARLYGITDMLMFGAIEDLKSYWCIPLEAKENVKLGHDDPTFYIKNKVGEGLLVQEFFNLTKFNPNWTDTDSNNFINKYFCIIDKEPLDFFWFKYERFIESINYNKKDVYRSWETTDFLDFLNYHNNK